MDHEIGSARRFLEAYCTASPSPRSLYKAGALRDKGRSSLRDRPERRFFQPKGEGSASSHSHPVILSKSSSSSENMDAAAQPAPGDGPSLLTIVGFAFLTFNAAMAMYSSNRGLGAISFVAFSYLDLSLLIYCLRLHERAARGSPRREHLKVAVWLLTTMLTFAVWPLLEFFGS